ncbi:MAG: hypothetical protein MJ252_15185 [archaeon]|nr:hypothetical protein [archaeon]
MERKNTRRQTNLLFNKFQIKLELPMHDMNKYYIAKDVETDLEVFIKKRENKFSLKSEAYRQLHLQGIGIPKLYVYGNVLNEELSKDSEVPIKDDIIISESLGKSLQFLFNKGDKKFKIGTFCNIAVNCIKMLEYIHSKGFIHRNIRPDTFWIGKQKNDTHNTIYITNFFYAKQYFTEHLGHIPKVSGKKLVKDPLFCSISAHLGEELSRKDDIESLGYVLCYFYKGNLPWFNLKGKTKEDQKKEILLLKINFPEFEIKRNYPQEFFSFFSYLKKIDFADKPNYKKLIGLFEKLARKNNAELEFKFNYNELEEFEKKKSHSKRKLMNKILKTQSSYGSKERSKNKRTSSKKISTKELQNKEEINKDETNNNETPNVDISNNETPNNEAQKEQNLPNINSILTPEQSEEKPEDKDEILLFDHDQKENFLLERKNKRSVTSTSRRGSAFFTPTQSQGPLIDLSAIVRKTSKKKSVANVNIQNIFNKKFRNSKVYKEDSEITQGTLTKLSNFEEGKNALKEEKKEKKKEEKRSSVKENKKEEKRSSVKTNLEKEDKRNSIFNEDKKESKDDGKDSSNKFFNNLLRETKRFEKNQLKKGKKQSIIGNQIIVTLDDDQADAISFGKE